MQADQRGNEAPSFLDALERVAKLAGAISGIALLISVVYDYAFLAALGLQFTEVPTTIADHLRSAIIWAPLLSGALLIGPILFVAGVAHGRNIADKAATADGLRIVDKAVVMLMIAFACGLLILGYAGRVNALYFGVFACVWLAVSVIIHRSIRNQFGDHFAALYMLLPAVCALVASAGFGQGEAIVKTREPVWRIELKSGDNVLSVDVSGVRRFNAAAVLIGLDGRSSVVPDAPVISTTKLASVPTSRP